VLYGLAPNLSTKNGSARLVEFISCALKTIAGGSFAHPKMFIFELGTDNQHPLVRLQDAWAVRPRYMLLPPPPVGIDGGSADPPPRTPDLNTRRKKGGPQTALGVAAAHYRCSHRTFRGAACNA